MKNQVQLITYVDRMGGNNLDTLFNLLTGPLKNVFGGVHLLPFFYPIDGEDAGFDPVDHTQVDPKIGSWQDVSRLSGELDIMSDLIVNHISADSPQFKDLMVRGRESEYDGLFLTFGSVFPAGASEEELLKIYRPRPGLPFTAKSLPNGSKRIFWTTFTEKQLDINVTHNQGKAYLEQILKTFQENGIRMIRIDAAGYAIKKPGTSCFMIPETFEFIENLTQQAHDLGIEVLVEIHAHFQQQISIAKRVDWVYDFALPPLILHTLFSCQCEELKHWLRISPRNAITVLDTHDGIGIVDVGPGSEPGEEASLMTPQAIDELVEQIHINSQHNSRKATGAAASNLDLYQVNCTYYEALGQDDQRYLIARMIQFYVPGIPQVYYVGLLAGMNDMELLTQTRVGRDINRHYYSRKEVEEELNRPGCKKAHRIDSFSQFLSRFPGRI